MINIIATIIVLMLMFPETFETRKSIAEIKSLWGEACVDKKDNEQ